MSLYSAWLMLSLLAPTADKEGRDVQTIFAAVGPRIHFTDQKAFAYGDIRLSPSACDASTDGFVDCSEALRQTLSRESGYETIVLLKPVLIRPDSNCSLIEMHSMMRRAIWENKSFQGLGFFADGTLSFIEPSMMFAQQEAFLLSNNEPVVVHSFIDVGICDNVSDHYDFKAFVQFQGPTEEASTRVWENQPQNYRLTSQRRGFDYTLDIIRP